MRIKSLTLIKNSAEREKRALVKTASKNYRKKTQQTQMPEN